jgi:L-ribulose-5-phosphate 3-epimerase
MTKSSRRDFLKSAATAAFTLGPTSTGLVGSVASSSAGVMSIDPNGPLSSGARLSVKKGLTMGMLPEKLTYAERFTLAKNVGFDLVQAPTTPDEGTAETIKSAADKAGIHIDSVMNMDHWKFPLSSSDPAIVEKSLAGMRTSLQNAKLWGSDVVLLVPGVVNSETSYHEAWVRSQTEIRKLIPLATEWKLVIALEEVWNKFLLSPLEMAAYIDEFKSPWIKAWFDVGNVVLYGYPQDWIHTLGKRIVKVHLKDFKRKEDGYAWVNLGDGDVTWPAVRQAFLDVGYSGSVIAELESGDEAYLRDVSHRIDRLVVG